MNCCSKIFFNTRFRQACDDRVPSIAEYLILDELSSRTEYWFSPSDLYLYTNSGSKDYHLVSIYRQ